MQYIEAPSKQRASHPIELFLAGGITGCPDWQSEVVDRLSGIVELTIFSPRRKHFDINSDKAEEQIEWEYEHLHRATDVVFWFPCETLCPIVLYELGAALERRAYAKTSIDEHEQGLYIGCHPDYKRIKDVQMQTKLICPDIKIYTSFESMLTEAFFTMAPMPELAPITYESDEDKLRRKWTK